MREDTRTPPPPATSDPSPPSPDPLDPASASGSVRDGSTGSSGSRGSTATTSLGEYQERKSTNEAPGFAACWGGGGYMHDYLISECVARGWVGVHL